MCLNCCGCCPTFKSRYKGLVDNIFPPNPQDGLVKNNMEKLTFYALSSPEKLDRIGEYLAQRVARDLNRHRIGYVYIAMQAMDQLLVACHAQSLNLFIESFLKIVQQLLETSDYQMQLLATSSFIRFANIEEDTPSYHRRYDFFVSKFSSLCHNGAKELDIRCKLRVAGLCGLRGVIRKTVSDDLQVDIWNEQHMDKIVPSLIYNLQDKESYLNIENGSSSCSTLKREVKMYTKSKNPLKRPLNKQPQSKNIGKNLQIDLIQPTFISSLDEESGNQQSQIIQQPQVVAEECLRELIGRANYGSIRSVIKPVLKHLDNHNLWNDENEFAVNIFKIIMYSIQSQHSYAVIQILMGHLDEKSKQQNLLNASYNDHSKEENLDNVEITTKVRTGIVTVLSSIVAIAAAESIGPSVLEIINSLLNYLHNSIKTYHNLKNLEQKEQLNETEECGLLFDEKVFQETIINTLGEFANNLPDFQKIEIMVFIINKVPKSDIYLQAILLKSLLKVSTKYETVNMVQAFPSNFLNPLLKLSTANDNHVRLTVQFIFHQLLDRHKNLQKLKSLSTLSALPPLTIGKAFRQDLMFMKKHGNEVLLRLYDNFKFPNNSLTNYHALFVTMALLCLEMGTEILAELLRFIFAVQDYALSCRPIKIPDQQKEDDKSSEKSLINNQSTNVVVNANNQQYQNFVNVNGLSDLHVCAIHAIVATFLRFTSQLTSIPAFVDYVEEVIKTRDNKFKYLLPEYNPLITNLDDNISSNHSISAGDSEGNTLKFEQDLELIDSLPSRYHIDDIKFEQLNESLFFNKNNIIEALLSSGHDTTLLQTPFTTGHTVVDSKISRSTSDLNSINVEVDSINSSPGLPRRRPEEGITFESFRKFLTDNADTEIKNAKRIQLVESYKTIAFEDLVYKQERKSSDLQNKLNELFSKLTNVKDMKMGTLDENIGAKLQDQSANLNNWNDLIMNNII